MATIHECLKCKGKLFVRWGLCIVISPENWKVSAMGNASLHAGRQNEQEVFACAHCKNPYYFDEYQMHDASSLVSSEEVEAALNALRSMPTGAKARRIDP